jgi:predicted nucleotidyltransferase
MKNIPKALEKVVKDLSKIPEVKAIYLYGSRARGEMRPSSDYDLCVIAGKDITEDAKTAILSKSGDLFDVNLLWNLPPVIRFRVFFDGKKLFVRDKLYVHRSQIESITEYQDLRHLYARYSQRLFG